MDKITDNCLECFAEVEPKNMREHIDWHKKAQRNVMLASAGIPSFDMMTSPAERAFRG